MTIAEIAKKHNVTEKYVQEQIAKGSKIEREHKSTAVEFDVPKENQDHFYETIATSHVEEFLYYYDDNIGIPAMEENLKQFADLKHNDLTLYQGKQGQTDEHIKSYENEKVFVIRTSEPEFLKHLLKINRIKPKSKEFKKLMDEFRVNPFVISKLFFEKLLSEKYDAILIKNEHVKGKPSEYHDLKEKCYYTPSKEMATLYAINTDRNKKYQNNNWDGMINSVQYLAKGGGLNAGCDKGCTVKGKLHSEGGEQFGIKGSDRKVELEATEVVITSPAVDNSIKHEFDGKTMGNVEILDSINIAAGGNHISEPKRFLEGGGSLENGADKQSFKNWFANSKVVDKKGNPLTVYHGSADLRGIKKDYIFNSEKASFFTDNYKMAKSYADPHRAFDYQNAEEGIIPVYLSLQNPLIVDAENSIWRKFETEINGEKYVGTKNIIEYAKTNNYDGVIVKNVRDYYNDNEKKSKGGNVYVCFSPTQIKLADGSNTTFDVNNADIRFDNGGNLCPFKMNDGGNIEDIKYIDIVSDLYNKYNAIKNEAQQNEWNELVKNTTFGTYGTISIFDIIENNKDEFNKGKNEVVLNDFLVALETALDIPKENSKYFKKGEIDWTPAFDYSTLFDKKEDIEVEPEKTIDEIREETYQKSGFSKQWASTYLEAVEKLKQQYKVGFSKLIKWDRKSYNKSTGSVFVGSEMEGDTYSFNYINEKRKKQNTNNAQIEMRDAAADMLELGLTKEDINIITNSIEQEVLAENPIVEKNIIENIEQPIITKQKNNDMQKDQSLIEKLKNIFEAKYPNFKWSIFIDTEKNYMPASEVLLFENDKLMSLKFLSILDKSKGKFKSSHGNYELDIYLYPIVKIYDSESTDRNPTISKYYDNYPTKEEVLQLLTNANSSYLGKLGDFDIKEDIDISIPKTKTENTIKIESSNEITIKDYSEKSILVKGDTYKYRNDFRGLGGLWNKPLGGWIFAKSKRSDIENIIGKTPDVSQSETTQADNGIIKLKPNQTIPRTASYLNRIIEGATNIEYTHHGFDGMTDSSYSNNYKFDIAQLKEKLKEWKDTFVGKYEGKGKFTISEKAGQRYYNDDIYFENSSVIDDMPKGSEGRLKAIYLNVPVEIDVNKNTKTIPESEKETFGKKETYNVGDRVEYITGWFIEIQRGTVSDASKGYGDNTYYQINNDNGIIDTHIASESLRPAVSGEIMIGEPSIEFKTRFSLNQAHTIAYGWNQLIQNATSYKYDIEKAGRAKTNKASWIRSSESHKKTIDELKSKLLVIDTQYPELVKKITSETDQELQERINIWSKEVGFVAESKQAVEIKQLDKQEPKFKQGDIVDIAGIGQYKIETDANWDDFQGTYKYKVRNIVGGGWKWFSETNMTQDIEPEKTTIKQKEITTERYVALKNDYEEKLNTAENNLQKIIKDNRDSSGLVNDATRNSDEYKEAKKDFDLAFKLLKEFNSSIPDKIKRDYSMLKREDKIKENTSSDNQQEKNISVFTSPEYPDSPEFKIKVANTYWDGRYSDYFVVLSITQKEGEDAVVTMKYQKGQTRTIAARMLLYDIKNKQVSLSTITTFETSEAIQKDDFVILTENYLTLSKGTIGHVLVVRDDKAKLHLGRNISGQQLSMDVDLNYLAKTEKAVSEKGEGLSYILVVPNSIAKEKEVWEMTFDEFLDAIKLTGLTYPDKSNQTTVSWLNKSAEPLFFIENTKSEDKNNEYIRLQLEKYHKNKIREAVENSETVDQNIIDFYKSDDSVLFKNYGYLAIKDVDKDKKTSSNPDRLVYEDENIKVLKVWETGVTTTGVKWAEYKDRIELKYKTKEFGWYGSTLDSLVSDLFNKRVLGTHDRKAYDKLKVHLKELSDLVVKVYPKEENEPIESDFALLNFSKKQEGKEFHKLVLSEIGGSNFSIVQLGEHDTFGFQDKYYAKKDFIERIYSLYDSFLDKNETAEIPDWLFRGIYPSGTVYSDKRKETNGDYHSIGIVTPNNIIVYDESSKYSEIHKLMEKELQEKQSEIKEETTIFLSKPISKEAQDIIKPEWDKMQEVIADTDAKLPTQDFLFTKYKKNIPIETTKTKEYQDAYKQYEQGKITMDELHNMFAEKSEVKIISEEIISPFEGTDDDLLDVYERMGEDAFLNGEDKNVFKSKPANEFSYELPKETKFAKLNAAWYKGYDLAKSRKESVREFYAKDEISKLKNSDYVKIETAKKQAALRKQKLMELYLSLKPVSEFRDGGSLQEQNYGKRLTINDIPASVKAFMPQMQQKAIVGSEEHWDVIDNLSKIISLIPITYKSGKEKIAYLHYFYGGSDWYIVEQDMGVIPEETKGNPSLQMEYLEQLKRGYPIQYQAFGYAILNGDMIDAEYGYISIEELKKTNKVELDFHWTPKPMSSIIAEKHAEYFGEETKPDVQEQISEPVKQNTEFIDMAKGKNQYQITTEIRALIDKNGLDITLYSPDELAYLRKYEGLGGLAGKGFGEREILDQFFTPDFLIQKMWGLAFKHGFNFKGIKAVLEPSLGVGRFLEYIPKHDGHIVDGFDVDYYSYVIAKLTFPDFNIQHKSFETFFFNGNRRIGLSGVKQRYNLVIGNPPYREYASELSGIKGLEMGSRSGKLESEKEATLASTFEQYMIMRGVDLLVKNGLLIFVIPNTFLSNDYKYNDFKELLATKCDLIDAYRLPNNVFQGTAISTDIIVLKKK